MIKINLYCTGSIKEKYFKDAIDEYSKRISKYATLSIIETQEVKIQKKTEEEVKKIESENALKRLKPNDYVILCDLHGRETNSEGFAGDIEKLLDKGVSPINIIIAGTLGFGELLIKRSNDRICFSQMTFPHQLMRVILLEQLYRSFKIINNENYHH